MREIKFRAWLRGKMYPLAVQWYSDGLEWLVPTDEGNLVTKDAIPMQFTGLKDKNGKEIYEGDIVNLIPDGYLIVAAEVTITARGIIFQRHDTGTGVFGADWCDLGAELNDAVVVGNIYDNPELLKEE